MIILQSFLVPAPTEPGDNGAFSPFMPNELFYENYSERSISNIRGVWLILIIIMFYRNPCI